MADEPLGCAEKRGVEGGLAGCVDCVGLHWHGGIVPVLCPHNKREENVAIKAGEVPGDWKNKPSKTVPERPGCPVERGGSENSPGGLLK